MHKIHYDSEKFCCSSSDDLQTGFYYYSQCLVFISIPSISLAVLMLAIFPIIYQKGTRVKAVEELLTKIIIKCMNTEMALVDIS